MCKTAPRFLLIHLILANSQISVADMHENQAGLLTQSDHRLRLPTEVYEKILFGSGILQTETSYSDGLVQDSHLLPFSPMGFPLTPDFIVIIQDNTEKLFLQEIEIRIF